MKKRKSLDKDVRKQYQHRMKKNKYFSRGYEAGKKGKKRQDNPYTLSEEIQALLRKRKYWEMGWEESAYTPSSKQLKAAKEKEKHGSKKRRSKH